MSIRPKIIATRPPKIWTKERDKFNQELGSLRSQLTDREKKHKQNVDEKDRKIASLMQEVDQLKTDLNSPANIE